ncbi:MAG: hypothetical protein ACMVY4_06340 [Minwuia sp.]|uniref:hypothetical protein n=1 Tax=Minwuia sp. TaxID=2493630 RepID=UPI003A8698A0
MADTDTRNPHHKRVVLFVANSDERQVDRTLMAAWSVRQRHQDAPIGVVTTNPGHRLWRTGMFNMVISAAGLRQPTVADCLRLAMERGIFERAVYMDSFCRLRAKSILPVFEALDSSPVCLSAVRTDEGMRISGRLVAMARGEPTAAFLTALAPHQQEAGGDQDQALRALIQSGEMRPIVKFGALGETWVPGIPAKGAQPPPVEMREGNSRRLYAEMLMFAMHRLVSSDMKRAAIIYARVAIASNPELPQLGAQRLVPHMMQTFSLKVPDMSGGDRDRLELLVRHAAHEDPAGNLLGIAALHLDVGQVKTAIAVLKMIHTMKFEKPVPVPE